MQTNYIALAQFSLEHPTATIWEFPDYFHIDFLCPQYMHVRFSTVHSTVSMEYIIYAYGEVKLSGARSHNNNHKWNWIESSIEYGN